MSQLSITFGYRWIVKYSKTRTAHSRETVSGILEERTVKKRREKQEEKICILKVTLSDVFGRFSETPHRILAIPERFTLYGLAEEIVNAFDFDFDHCFGFLGCTRNARTRLTIGKRVNQTWT